MARSCGQQDGCESEQAVLHEDERFRFDEDYLHQCDDQRKPRRTTMAVSWGRVV